MWKNIVIFIGQTAITVFLAVMLVAIVALGIAKGWAYAFAALAGWFIACVILFELDGFLEGKK